ncbi:hypothetical protein [Methanosarcina sp. 1.H.A.2.2]|jgi:hypothetical protein|nr:hypothetical protein [Methanosarcina sp. 1.H.A.2.2]
MQLILARKTVVDRHIRDPVNKGFMPYEGKALQAIVLVYICVAISV